MGNFVNLNEVGALTQSGKQYGVNGENNATSAKSHYSKMEGLQPAFRGHAGSTHQVISGTQMTNHSQLAQQIVEQARRAVTAEVHAITGDEQADSAQQGARGASEALTSVVSRPVNV